MLYNFGLDVNTRSLLMCGDCNNPVAYHTDDYRSVHFDLDICDRTFDSARSGYDYFLHPNNAVTPYEDYSGNPVVTDVTWDDSTFRLEDDPNYHIPVEHTWESIDNYYDKNPAERTHAIDYWHVVPGQPIKSGSYSSDHPNATVHTIDFDGPRTTFVEGTDGFVSRTLIDPVVTERFHYRMLNAFIHKRTKNFHVGSIELTFEGSVVTATCINRDCNRKNDLGTYVQAAIRIDRDLVERPAMEAFVYQIIRHGNNHGPHWLTTRPDFYKLHAQDCDLNCNDAVRCNSGTEYSSDTEVTDVEFVMNHQRLCKDANCKCSEWLETELLSAAS